MKLLPIRARNTAALFAGVLSLVLSVQLCHAQDEERGRKYKAPPPISHIAVTVTRASNGKPVENAAVIFHTFHNGKDMGNMELKTDEDGKAVLDVIPLGDEVRLQVFKIGFQTYGDEFTNDLASRDLKIKVKPPTGQYSSYESHPVDSNSQQSVTPQPTEGSAKPPAAPHN